MRSFARRDAFGILVIGSLLGVLLTGSIPGGDAKVGDPIIAGERTTAGTMQTRLWAVANNSALKVTNKLSGHPALWLEVRDDTTPPLRVSSPALVENLNADTVDGMDASAFALAGSVGAPGSACPPGPMFAGFDASGDAVCFGVYATVVDAGRHDVGTHGSMALDTAGNPVIAYYDATDGDLKLVHCGDPYCRDGDASIETVDSTGDVGMHASLALDTVGDPVIAYYDSAPNFDLKLVHCNDPNCTGSDESIETVDATGDVGRHASLTLDGSGNPVVSYDDTTNGELKLVRCNDPNCTGGDETIKVMDVPGDDVNQDGSLVIDGSGNPVISYYNTTSDWLMLMTCTDPVCDTGFYGSLDPAGGEHSSLALDGSGNPVVSSYDADTGNLRVTHCNDTFCTGGDESTETIDNVGTVCEATSLVLDAHGNPIIAHYDAIDDEVRVARCRDPECSTYDPEIVTIASAGVLGAHASAVLDAAGNPVIAYYDDTSGYLHLAVAFW
jgi:hypothetical protein